MRKSINFIALVIIWILAGCEDETLDPRTNPRFSVALIQEVSANGVQFGANIYEFGGEEIVEYGFAYSSNGLRPNLDTDDFVSEQGRPEAYFELFANHSLTLGKKYYVTAFLRTTTGMIYSKPMEFVSQGSEGFIIHSVEWPDVIYRGQKLLVKGSRFSRKSDNYKIKLGRFEAYPQVLDSNTFTIELPAGLLTQTTGETLEAELRIEINEKSYTESRILKFQEPIFEPQPIQMIDFDEEVVIRGDFLDLGSITLGIDDKEISGLIAAKNELRFYPYKETGLIPTTAQKEITYTVRGKSYPLGKVFAINGPKINEEKIVLNKNSVMIPAVNFNINDLTDIRFFDEGGKEINLDVTEVSTSGITVNTYSAVYPGRNFKMQLKSFGVLSNFAEIEVANPVALIDATGQQYQYERNDLALTSNGKAYVLTSGGIIEETLGLSVQRKIADLPADFSQRYQFIRQAVEGGFVIGGGGSINMEPFRDLYFFSLQQMKWEKLPDLPEPLTSFKLVTSKNGFLVFEEALKVFDELVGERWKLDLQTKVWERLPTAQSRFINFQTFYHNGDVFIYGVEYSSANRAIYRMDDHFMWEVVLETPNLTDNSDFATPLVIDGKFYVLSDYLHSIVEIDLATKSIKGYPYPYSYFYGAVPVVYSDRIYILSGQNIMEDIRLSLY